MNLGRLMVPELFVVLLVNRQAPDILRLLKYLFVLAPSRVSYSLFNDMDWLGKVSGVSHVSIHGDLMLTRHICQVNVLGKALQIR